MQEYKSLYLDNVDQVAFYKFRESYRMLPLFPDSISSMIYSPDKMRLEIHMGGSNLEKVIPYLDALCKDAFNMQPQICSGFNNMVCASGDCEAAKELTLEPQIEEQAFVDLSKPEESKGLIASISASISSAVDSIYSFFSNLFSKEGK